MIGKKRILFAHPETQMLKFDRIFEHLVNSRLLVKLIILRLKQTVAMAKKS